MPVEHGDVPRTARHRPGRRAHLPDLDEQTCGHRGSVARATGVMGMSPARRQVGQRPRSSRIALRAQRAVVRGQRNSPSVAVSALRLSAPVEPPRCICATRGILSSSRTVRAGPPARVDAMIVGDRVIPQGCAQVIPQVARGVEFIRWRSWPGGRRCARGGGWGGSWVRS